MSTSPMRKSLAFLSKQRIFATVAFCNVALCRMVAIGMMSALALGRYPLSVRDVIEFLMASLGVVRALAIALRPAL